MSLMRRALAVLLVVAFSLPLIAPALVSFSIESSLPACCRRNGAHHCAMMQAMSVNVSSRTRTIGATCPYAPFSHEALMMPHARSSGRMPSAVAAVAGPAALVRDVEAGYRISFERSRQKRGPPSLAL